MPGNWIAQGQWATDRGVAEVVEQEGFGIVGAWISATGEAAEQRERITTAVSMHDRLISHLRASVDYWVIYTEDFPEEVGPTEREELKAAQALLAQLEKVNV